MKRLIRCFSIGMVCLLAFTSLEAQELTDDLALAFSFEEGTGDTVRDLSLQGNDGEIDGTADWVDGKFGKALHFDGQTWVLAPHIPFDDRSYTVQLWVKPEMNTEKEVVFGQHKLNSANLSLHFRIHNNGMVRFGHYSNDLDTPVGAVQKDEWHNLTFLFDVSDKSRTIYIDGEEIASDISPSSYLGDVGDTTVGGWERPTKEPFYQFYYGTIDEVRVWHRLLSEDEILSSMETEMSVEPSGKLAAIWAKIKYE